MQRKAKRPHARSARISGIIRAIAALISLTAASDGLAGTITNPVISSFSGYDYNPLKNGLPPRVIGATRDASSFTVQWTSFAGQSTFAAYATDELTRPRVQWSKIGQNIPNTGSTNSFTESGIEGIPRRFYVIENE